MATIYSRMGVTFAARRVSPEGTAYISALIQHPSTHRIDSLQVRGRGRGKYQYQTSCDNEMQTDTSTKSYTGTARTDKTRQTTTFT